jgi:GNAT superfamily N-acetyltransferase
VCESTEQTDWLRRFARQSVSMGSAKVFVVTPVGSDQVVAYYAWCMAQLAASAAPERLRQGAGRYPQPVALLARLGVDTRHAGQGLGAGLVADVLARVAAMVDEIGCRGLLVHAESQVARAFYLHLVPEFEPSPTDDLHLVLLTKDIRRTLRGLP